jgi:hypothetical protein
VALRSERLKEELAALEQDAKAMCAQLDDLVIASRPEIASQAEKWIDVEVGRTIEEQAETVQALGIDRIREFKARVSQVRSSVAAALDAATSEQAHFPHRVPNDPTAHHLQSREGYFNAAFRQVISTLGPVFDEFGLIVRRADYLNSWEGKGSKMRYALNPGLEMRPNDFMAQYIALNARYGELQARLTAKLRDLEKAKAREMWDSA